MKTERAQQKQTTLVLGGTGKTGRRVAQRLVARGVPTRVGSPLRRAALRLGGRGDVGARPARRGVGVHLLLP